MPTNIALDCLYVSAVAFSHSSKPINYYFCIVLQNFKFL